MTTFKVGQELYYVPTYSEPKIVTITKVGRKFLTVKLFRREYRVYIDTLIVDGNGYNSPGRCYLPKEEHDKQRYVKDLWDSIRDKFNTFSLPDWATVDNLSKIKELIEKMKVIIAGSRTITRYGILEFAIQKSGFIISEVVSGCANGVDKLGMMYARNNNLSLKKFPVNWQQFGKASGFKRNIDMVKYADALLAIWDQQSRGTLHIIQTAKEHNLIVYTHFI